MRFSSAILACQCLRYIEGTAQSGRISWLLPCISSTLFICVMWMWQISCMHHIVCRIARTSGDIRFFSFLLDMMLINMFIIYWTECKKRSQKSVSHLQLCEALIRGREPRGDPQPLRTRSFHYPIFMELQ
jgi:hypothetical protein